ncbi:MAG: hypothetical protein P8Y96_11195 [Desulfuromonadales bacterium]
MMAAKQDSPAVRKGRRFTLIGLVLILVLLGAWLTSFLVRFDLNDYRQEVEAQLSAWLSLPVRIGNIRYNVHQTNLALQITDLEIGTADTPLQVVAPNVLADLQWQALLRRELKFGRITVTTPQFWVRPAASAGEENLADKSVQDPIKIDRALLSSTRPVSSFSKATCRLPNPSATAPGNSRVKPFLTPITARIYSPLSTSISPSATWI